jgi:hypothetical protein
MKQQEYKNDLNENKSIEFIHVMNLLRTKLEKINDDKRLDILMHMLLSKGVCDLVNIKKGIQINAEDYSQLTKDDYIKTTENILSELEFFKQELDGLIN